MSATETLTPQEIFSHARFRAAKVMPYFRYALHKLIPIEAPGLGTFGVTPQWQLLWDPKAALQWGVEHTATILIHEILHPMRRHFARFRAIAESLGFTILSDDDMRKIPKWMAKHWNIVADCEINASLVWAGLKFPPGFCWLPEDLSPPQKRGLLAEEMWDATFNKAKEEQENKDKSQDKQGGSGEPGDQSAGEPGDSEDERSEGSEGSEGGAGAPGEDEGDLSKGTCGSGATGVPTPAEDKFIPQDAPGRTPEEVEAIIRGTAARIKEHASKKPGTVPGGLTRWAEDALAPPKVNWRRKLQREMRNGISTKGKQDYTRSRIARRQHAYGWSVGSVIVPGMHAYNPKILVAYDTSASMADKDILASLSETQAILKNSNADVKFCACDAKIQSAVSVKNMTQIRKEIKGGGGTDFRPVFKSLEGQRDKPDIIVFFTDGCGPAPDSIPPGILVIWVLVGDYRQKPYSAKTRKEISYGTFIEVDS